MWDIAKSLWLCFKNISRIWPLFLIPLLQPHFTSIAHLKKHGRQGLPASVVHPQTVPALPLEKPLDSTSERGWSYAQYLVTLLCFTESKAYHLQRCLEGPKWRKTAQAPFTPLHSVLLIHSFHSALLPKANTLTTPHLDPACYLRYTRQAHAHPHCISSYFSL